MNLKVKYDELKDIGNFVSIKAAELEIKTKDIAKLIPNIETSWTGNDSDVFVSKLKSFVDKEKILNEKIRILGEIINASSKVYSDKDLEWQLEVKKEKLDYGKKYGN